MKREIIAFLLPFVFAATGFAQPDTSRASILLDRYSRAVSIPVTDHSASAPLLTADGVNADRPFEVVSIRKVPQFARSWFITEYDSLAWVFRGSRDITRLDTTLTAEIRGHLESEYGPPSQVLADLGLLHSLDLEEYVQFEYWFVLNGEIPFRVLDVNGPFERGVVVSAPEKYREALDFLRDVVVGSALRNTSASPYVDYYFEPEILTWYRAGFDGKAYFVDEINPRAVPQGRPRLKSE